MRFVLVALCTGCPVANSLRVQGGAPRAGFRTSPRALVVPSFGNMPVDAPEVSAKVEEIKTAVPDFGLHWWTLDEAAQLLDIESGELTSLLGEKMLLKWYLLYFPVSESKPTPPILSGRARVTSSVFGSSGLMAKKFRLGCQREYRYELFVTACGEEPKAGMGDDIGRAAHETAFQRLLGQCSDMRSRGQIGRGSEPKSGTTRPKRQRKDGAAGAGLSAHASSTLSSSSSAPVAASPLAPKK